MKSIVLLAVFLTVAAPAAAQGQVHLPQLQQEAVERDPRTRQLALQETAAERRVRNIAAERLPTFTVVGQAHCQVPLLMLTLYGVAVSGSQ